MTTCDGRRKVVACAVVVAALALAGAKPPEPLEDVFPQTSAIVDAVVVRVVSEDAVDPASTSTSKDAPKQVLLLKVNRVVRGQAALAKLVDKDGQLTVVKPAAPYKVKAGIKGPWLLHVDDKAHDVTVLGRYGPDSYTFEKLDAKLKELDPPSLR